MKIKDIKIILWIKLKIKIKSYIWKQELSVIGNIFTNY